MLPLSFYRNPDVVQVAQNLLGKALYTRFDGRLTGGIIIETEAYLGVTDKASHAFGGRRTKRTEVLYRKGGCAYVHLCYGIHCLLNVVTGEEEVPMGVLIRALRPTDGIETMLLRRKKQKFDATLTGGPGSLSAALGITLESYGQSLRSDSLWIEDTGSIQQFEATPRIGVDYAGEWAQFPYRFLAK